MSIKKTVSLGLALAGLAAVPSAQAEDCYILVHGHGPALGLATAHDYWEGASFIGRNTDEDEFVDDLTRSADHVSVVTWDGTDSELAYWESSKSVAEQISRIVDGNADDAAFDDACEGDEDLFYVVAHSQGAQLMTYISANSVPGSQNYNTSYANAPDLSDLTAANAVTADFADAMSNIEAIFTLGGAVNGTEGMDIVCGSGLAEAFVGLLGESCNVSMQTDGNYNPSALTDRELGVDIYALGGYRGLPGTSILLGGEDDGVINLASQMNCEGSPKRDLEKDLVEYTWGFWPTFRCDNDHKRHDGHFTMGSFHEDHDSERNAYFSYPDHEEDAEDAMSCSFGQNMAHAIYRCL